MLIDGVAHSIIREVGCTSGVQFATYGDCAYQELLNCAADAARATGLFDTIHVLTKSDAAPEQPNSDTRDSRKPSCVLELFSQMDDDGILFWADPYCTFSDVDSTREQLSNFFKLAREHESGVLRFNSHRKELVWTKRDVFERVHPSAFQDECANQFMGDRFIVRKCDGAAGQLHEWIDCISKHTNMFDDSPSLVAEVPEFRRHRHHHSVFSLISKRRGCAVLNAEDIGMTLIANHRRQHVYPTNHIRADAEHVVQTLTSADRNLAEPVVVHYDAVIAAHMMVPNAEEKASLLLQRHGDHALHHALLENQGPAAAWLAVHGDICLLVAKNKKKCTPLMLMAMGHCRIDGLNIALIWQCLVRCYGAGIVDRSMSGQSVADYAEAHGCGEEVVEALRRLEVAEFSRSTSFRCCICNEKVSRYSVLAHLADRASRGEEGNTLLQRFFKSGYHCELLKPCYHQINDMRQIRKELSESIALLDALKCALPSISNSWHVVDLCCGRSVTAAIMSQYYPEMKVTAVDKIAPKFLPHFNMVPGCNVQYVQMDVMNSKFIQELEKIIEGIARPSVIIGMHLCGNLSIRAIEAFHLLPKVQGVILSPCCLPPKSDAASPIHLYASNNSADQYQEWALHLKSLLCGAAPGMQVTSAEISDILSPKNAVICAVKPSMVQLRSTDGQSAVT